MNPVVMQLTRRGLLGRQRAVLLVLLPVVLLLLALLVRWASGGDTFSAVNLVDGFGLGTLLPLTCLLIGTGVVGTEIDDGSIVYLLAKPIPRRTILTSKLLVAWAAALVFAALPIVLATVIAAESPGALTGAYAVTAVLAALAYTTVFVAVSVLSRNAVIIGLLYALLWETILGGYVPGIKNASIRQWALTAAEAILGEDRAALLRVESAVSLPAGLILLAVVAVVAVVVGVRRLQTLPLATAD